MKKLSTILVAGFLYAILIGGSLYLNAEEKKNAASDAVKVKKSMVVWLKLKAKWNGNYSYKYRFRSWVGFGNETTIVIRANKVVERHYRSWNRAQKVREKWVEKGDQIGTHRRGAKALTLDKLYQKAKFIAKKKLSANEERYTSFDRHGLLNLCCYRDKRIVDDAPLTGVKIYDIKPAIISKKVQK